MAKFLILHSSNKSNIGIIRDYSDTYISPDAIKLTEQEVNEWNTISAMERKFRLEDYKSTNDKKKIFTNVELVERVEEPVLVNLSHSHFGENVKVIMADKDAFLSVEKVEMSEIEVEEPLNEPINEVKVVEKPKAKGRPKKNK